MDQFTMDEALSHRVGPGFRLADVDPSSTPGFEWDKEDWEREFHEHDDELDELQEMLFANGRSGVPGTGGVLLVLQGMDTAGKGGVIRHVFRAFDPQALKIRSFGPPTAEERRHDFLWRVRPHEPAVGQIAVFDRSHYEDVLIQRVRGMAPPEEIERRYGAIVDFERDMASRNVRIIKVMLHISKEFQKENLLERLENPEKHWKYNPGDLDERELWDEYQEAYEIAMKRTSTDFAPWYCIPGDRKKYARMAVKYLMLDALRSMNMTWPSADFDVAKELERARKA
ncbi:MAG: PPK2 family polyphosphate--nucleotide phosphotransferase [Corynebacterium humireducens]|jgi:PPK2 family polyphosphate:nucleotide phosphotransferase|uniref:PPK2 family polyphosphate--nucleotide phosphotransferase n=1 Tax=Corynebacterium humireducens TaxID=1223514 RepID=A0A7X6PNA1_9CORY|nr:PPK2 family polyphosphate--nucleotide phosphotransferase [Corynebacterium humireducens]